jgi:hypothetical protein
VASLPSFANNGSIPHQFLDLAGSGQLDCVVLDRPLAGYFERDDGDWDRLRSLPSVANIEWNDPNLRFIDIDGDGHADVLVTEDEVFAWRQLLAEDGFGPAVRVSKARDEETGPAIAFADATQAVFLADMSGDGLTDIVRIRSGENLLLAQSRLRAVRPKNRNGQRSAPRRIGPVRRIARPPRRHRRLRHRRSDLSRAEWGTTLFQSVGKRME